MTKDTRTPEERLRDIIDRQPLTGIHDDQIGILREILLYPPKVLREKSKDNKKAPD